MNKKLAMQPEIGGLLVKALGLPTTATKITIEIAVGQPVLVTCTYWPDMQSMELMAEKVALFELVPKVAAP